MLIYFVYSFLDKDVLVAIIGFIGVVAGVFLASYLGFREYRKQKMHEDINEKYIKGGIELLIGDIEKVSSVIESNFTDAMYLLGYVRESKNFNDSVFLKGWIIVLGKMFLIQLQNLYTSLLIHWNLTQNIVRS